MYRSVLCVVLLALVGTGCAATRPVAFDEPHGATVVLNGTTIGTMPLEHRVRVAEVHHLSVEVNLHRRVEGRLIVRRAEAEVLPRFRGTVPSTTRGDSMPTTVTWSEDGGQRQLWFKGTPDGLDGDDPDLLAAIDDLGVESPSVPEVAVVVVLVPIALGLYLAPLVALFL